MRAMGGASFSSFGALIASWLPGCAVGPELLVIGIGSAHCDGSSGGRVGDVLAAGVNGALGGGIFGAVALQSAEIYPSFSGHPTEAPLPEGTEPVFFR